MAIKVNEKSTKPEIWAAYKALLTELQTGPVTISSNDAKVNQLGVALEQTKSELLAQFETAKEVASSAANDYIAAEQTLVRRKSEIIDGLERSRTELQEAINQARKDWEQQRADQMRSREREAEEYAYELAKKRRADEEAFQAKWQVKFTDLNAREAKLKDQEDRLAELEQTAQKAPEQLQSAIKNACDALAKELKQTHATELKETNQRFEHQTNILALKLQTAEASIATKDRQLGELQKQLDSASSQLKDMAVTVIRSNSQTQPTALATN